MTCRKKRYPAWKTKASFAPGEHRDFAPGKRRDFDYAQDAFIVIHFPEHPESV